MTGDDLKEARLAHGWTQEQLGQLIGETKTVVGNWERGGHVPRRKESAVRKALADLEDPEDDPVRSLSDTALIAELARRLADRQRVQSEGGLMQGETYFADSPAAGSVTETPTSAPGVAGPHSAPRRHR